MNIIKATILRYRRFLVIVSSCFAVYTLIGFFALPWLAEKQLIQISNKRLGVEAAVKKIAFNPYTFELTLNGLQLKSSEREPLLNLEQLYVNAEPLQLFKLDLTIDEITFTRPQLHFNRFSAADNTLTRLSKKWAETAQSKVAEPSPEPGHKDAKKTMVTFRLNTLNYVKGELHYVDDVPKEPFQTVLTPINIRLAHFSTEVGQAASNDIVINLEDGAELALNGKVVLSPLHVDGRVQLKNLSLETPYRYIKTMLPFELKQGRLNLDLAYNVDVDGADIAMQLNKMQADVADFSIYQMGEKSPLMQAGRLTLKNGEFHYPENALNIASIKFDDYKVFVSQDEKGELNWLNMLANMPKTETEDVAEEKSGTPFKLNVASISANSLQLEVQDNKPATPLNLSLNINSELKSLNLEPDNTMPLTVNVALASGGTVAIDSNLQLFPAFAITSKLNVSQLELQPVQSYLDEFAFITFKKGNVNSQATFASSQNEPFALQGEMTLVDMQLDNQRLNERLLSVDKLAINNVDLSVSEQRLIISEINADKLYSRVKITDKGETNIGLLMKQNTQNDATSEAVPAPQNNSKFAVSVGKVTINDASSSYTDENLPIVFNANMTKLNGSISGFSTQSAQPMEMALEGQVDEFGLVEINGQINPMDVTHQTNIKLDFTNLALPSLTPYTIKFAGREVDDGAGDIELLYEVVDGMLNANNKLRIRDFRLGERVESPDAMDLPLDLAIALLKNSDGVIDLSIPVTGNVNDPQFDLGPVIRGAIANVLGNIVSAPFRFLANLFGGGEPVENVRFRPGRLDITPPEQEKLLKLSEALQKRPQLVLRIPAPYDATADANALKVKAVETRIQTQLEQMSDETQLLQKTQQVLESLYVEAKLEPSIDAIKAELIEASKTAEEPDGKLDTLKLNARIKSRLIELETVSDDQLENLASSRQKEVINFMQAKSQLSQEQLQSGDTIEQVAKEGWVALPFKLGSI